MLEHGGAIVFAGIISSFCVDLESLYSSPPGHMDMHMHMHNGDSGPYLLWRERGFSGLWTRDGGRCIAVEAEKGRAAKRKKTKIALCNDICAAWWPRCAARRWRAADRGADPAAAPSRAAGRGAASAPKRTRARGAAAAAKTSTPQLLLLFSSRLVLSQAHTRATCARVAAFAPRRAIRTGSQSARRRRAAAKCTTLTSLRCCCFGTP